MANAIISVIALTILGICIAVYAAQHNVGPRRIKNG